MYKFYVYLRVMAVLLVQFYVSGILSQRDVISEEGRCVPIDIVHCNTQIVLKESEFMKF